MGIKKAMINTMTHEKHDHFDTPSYAVKPLLQHIDCKWTIWEPTDTTGNSQIVRVLEDHGCSVISTGKDREGDKTQRNLYVSPKFDFLKDTPDFEYDCIVTNPPYSLKDKFIARCMETKKRWAMLLPITGLEGTRRGKMFREMGDYFGLLVLDRRVEFASGSVWFNSSWFCYGLLPKQLMFAELNKNADT